MSLFQKVKCTTGFHIFDWRPSGNLQEPCELVSVCAACQRRSTKITHAFVPWQPTGDDPCARARSCQQCGRVETRMDHAYGQPYFAQAYSCELARSCALCGETEQIGTQHSYTYVYANEWRPSNPATAAVTELLHAVLRNSPAPCDVIYVCHRCDHQQVTNRRQQHEWSQWTYRTADQLMRTCGRCREHEYQWI